MPSVLLPPARIPGGAFGGGGFYQQPQPNRKVLSAGTAGSPVGTVYTVPLRTTTEITSIHAHNYDAGAQTLDVYVRGPSGTSSLIHRISMNAATSSAAYNVMSGMTICLGPDWEVRLLASKAASIDYLITGIEYFIPTGGATA